VSSFDRYMSVTSQSNVAAATWESKGSKDRTPVRNSGFAREQIFHIFSLHITMAPHIKVTQHIVRKSYYVVSKLRPSRQRLGRKARTKPATGAQAKGPARWMFSLKPYWNQRQDTPWTRRGKEHKGEKLYLFGQSPAPCRL
jgi:hypothetical protein